MNPIMALVLGTDMGLLLNLTLNLVLTF